MHGANPKNPGGAPIKHGLYCKEPGERLRQAIEAAQAIKGLEPELELLRTRLALFVETVDPKGEATLGAVTLESLAKIIGRIESLVKSIQQLKLVEGLGDPQQVTVVVGAMGAVIREYVPQNRWKEALDRLDGLITPDDGEPEAGRPAHA